MVRLPLTPDEIARGERLGALLRRARESRTMLDVALHAGVSPETLRKIESGRVATPAFSTIAAIAGVLELSLDDLWSEVSDTHGEPARRDRDASLAKVAEEPLDRGAPRRLSLRTVATGRSASFDRAGFYSDDGR